jgi:RHS repeat-associated protein
VTQAEHTYEPFGTTTTTGSTGNAFQYTGRENDGTGLYYYRARYYHPGLQRFISEDPIGFAGGDANPYAYVRNNPLLFVDPSGHVINLAGAGVGALIGGVIGATSAALSGGNTTQIIAGAGFGALSGATLGVTLGGSILVNTAFGAGVGLIADATGQLLATGTIDPISAVIGGAAGALGGRAAFQAGAAGLSAARAAGLGGLMGGATDIGGRLAFPTGKAEGALSGAPPLSGRK